MAVSEIAESANAVLPTDMITSSQIRAARALIGWKQTDLAEAAGLSEMTIKNIERDGSNPTRRTLEDIQAAFEAAGVLFLDPGVNRDGGSGLRLK